MGTDAVTDVDIAELTTRLQVALGRLARLLRREAPSSLGVGSLSAMSTLAAEGPLRPTDLAMREGVRPPTMTRVIGALEESGYIVREMDPADRRSHLVELTPLGAEVLAGTRNARAGRLARHLADLDEDERHVLATALPVLEALAEVDSTVDTTTR